MGVCPPSWVTVMETVHRWLPRGPPRKYEVSCLFSQSLEDAEAPSWLLMVAHGLAWP